MRKYIMFLFILCTGIFLLIGCSNADANNNQQPNNKATNNKEEKDHNQAENNNRNNENESAEDMVVETDDGRVTFTLRNGRGLSGTTMEALKKRILDAYDYVKESIDTPY